MLSKSFYDDALFDQYLTGRGFQAVNIHDKYVIEDYNAFLKERQNIIPNYLKLLEDLEVDYDNETTVEVGKGLPDSVVVPYSATIVTPYKGLFEERKGKVIEGKPIILNGDMEVIHKYSMSNGRITKELDIPQGRIYMTQNFYSPSSINGWYDLLPKNDIVLGVFGLMSDKDKEDKINAIYDVAGFIEDSKLEAGVLDDGYYCAVRLVGKEKRLVKEKTL